MNVSIKMNIMCNLGTHISEENIDFYRETKKYLVGSFVPQ